MPISVTHTFVSPVTDAGDPNEVGPNEWNAAHTVTGAVAASAESYNRIVNPAMQHSQELGISGTATAGAYIVDQWQAFVSGISFAAAKSTAYTTQQIQITTTTGKALAAGDYMGFTQLIEGVRLWDFSYGSSLALASVLRFETYCNIAGTFGVSFRNAAGNRSFVLPFTVSTPNVWTTFTVSIPGDTTGTWPVDNTKGAEVAFVFAAGTTFTTSGTGWQAGNFIAPTGITNGAATTNNTFYIRNIGLYLDPQNTGVAPAWQMPDYTEELIKCQRYFANNLLSQFAGNVTSGVGYYGIGAFPVFTRTTPAVTGVHENSYSFPTSPGSYSIVGGTSVRELRTANQSGSGHFSSIMTANARM